MARKGRRTLTPEERDLWDKVKQTAQPLRPDRPAPKVEDVMRPTKVETPEPAPIPVFKVGQNAKPVSLPAAAPTLPQMDRKAYHQLRRGKGKPEGRIDLHGMTLAEAHPELTRFILGAHADGKRLVLVITGKGKDRDDGGPIPVRRGILRHHVPQWLRLPGLGHAVLDVVEAHAKHGGSGAYYVYLRRRR